MLYFGVQNLMFYTKNILQIIFHSLPSTEKMGLESERGHDNLERFIWKSVYSLNCSVPVLTEINKK